VYVLFSVAVLAALGTYAWRGWYARYVTDDYCTASYLQTYGFVEVMGFYRRIWSGRYSFYLVKSALETIGPVTARITPAALLLCFAGATAWTIHRLFAPGRLLTLAAAAAVTYAVIDSSPSIENIGGSFFWETGSVTYLLPLALLTIWPALLSCRRSLWVCCTASALLMLFVGGFNETSLAAQGALTGGTLLVALRLKERRMAWIAAAGLVATLIALAIMATAPGTMVRAAAQTEPLSPGAAVLRSLGMAHRFIGSHVLTSSLAVLPLLAVAPMLKKRRDVALYAAMIAAAAYVVAFLPTAWLMGGAPERALDVPNYFLVAALFALATLIPRVPAWGVVLLCVIPLLTVVRNAERVPQEAHTAAQVDALEHTLRTHKGEHVAVRARWALNERRFGASPDHFANQCASRLYGLQSLRIVR
jgi:hypothetical protein